jgi:hypothetical protein
MEGNSAKSFDRGVLVGDTDPFSLTAGVDWACEGVSETPVFFSSSFAGTGAAAGDGEVWDGASVASIFVSAVTELGSVAAGIVAAGSALIMMVVNKR